MITFPNGKINLGLQVLAQRPDGYHTIETIFYPVPLHDILEITPAPQAMQPTLQLYGLPVKGDAADNLCIRAWQLLKAAFPHLPPVAIHLLKNIPMGAGLGGGSADGAYMLQLLNSQFNLLLTDAQLAAYALQLGSDCPFFIFNKPCYATGRGELLEHIELSLTNWQLVLVNPGIHIRTGWAFGQLANNKSLTKKPGIQQLVRRPVAEWKDALTNDFEMPVFNMFPAIKGIKENLYQRGAVYAAMSGSGSSVFGLFEAGMNLTSGLPGNYMVIRL